MSQKRKLDGLKVLVVEDNLLIQKFLSVELEESGCVVELASNGQEAVEKVKTNQTETDKYHVVLMDIMMPIMDGDQATQIIRETISKELPIIAVTAYSREEVKKRCLALGMNDFLVKPVDIEVLKKRILHWTGRDD